MKYCALLPTLSVILLQSQQQSELKHSLASLAQQSLAPLEIICVQAQETLHDFVQNITFPCAIKYISPKGPLGTQYAAALQQAQGDYVLFLHVPDTFFTTYSLEKAILWLQQHPCPVLLSDYTLFSYNTDPTISCGMNPVGHLIKETPSTTFAQTPALLALTSLCNKIFSRKFLQEKAIHFNMTSNFPHYALHAQLLHQASFTILESPLFRHAVGKEVATISLEKCKQELDALQHLQHIMQPHIAPHAQEHFQEFLWGQCLRHAKKIALASLDKQERLDFLQQWHLFLSKTPLPSHSLGNNIAQEYTEAISHAKYQQALDILTHHLHHMQVYPFFDVNNAFFYYKERYQRTRQWQKYYAQLPTHTAKTQTTQLPLEVLPQGRTLLLWGQGSIEVLDKKQSISLQKIVGKESNFAPGLQHLMTTSSTSKSKTNHSSSLRILALCSSTQSKAGKACLRHVQHLRDLGHDARLLCLHTTQEHPFVARIVPPLKTTHPYTSPNAWQSMAHKISLAKEESFKGHDDFSDVLSFIDIRTLQPLIDWAEIIDIHCLLGIYDFAHFPQVFKDKKIVYHLADMYAFTGGCHYAAQCIAYQQNCLTCPQLSEEKKHIPHALWEKKKEALSSLQLHVVAPSPQLLHAARQSALLGSVPIHCIPHDISHTSDISNNADILQLLNREKAREYAHIPPDAFVILFGCTKKELSRKGSELLEKSLVDFEKNFPQLAEKTLLLTVGNKHFQTQTSLATYHIGNVPQRYMPLLYAAAHVTVLPSVEDANPLTLGESLLCGTAVVSFSSVELTALLGIHKESVYVARAFDTQDFAQGIAWAFTLPTTEAYGARIRALAAMHCAPKQKALTCQSLYTALLEGKTFTPPALPTVQQDIAAATILKRTQHYKETAPKYLPTESYMVRHWVMRHNERKKEAQIFSPQTDFNDFTYARPEHMDYFIKGYLLNDDASPVHASYCDLKAYQDGLCTAFIDQMFGEKPIRILEIGGAHSRILNHYCVHHQHECWNIDKFEGIGNGPKGAPTKPRFTLVQSYMGDFSPELPNEYFDLVFSTSVLEHVPEEEAIFEAICKDIDRVLKPDGYSLHLMDFGLHQNKPSSMHGIIPYLFSHRKTLNNFVSPEEYKQKFAIYGMTHFRYDFTWKNALNTTYAEFGMPTSINVFWKK